MPEGRPREPDRYPELGSAEDVHLTDLLSGLVRVKPVESARPETDERLLAEADRLFQIAA